MRPAHPRSEDSRAAILRAAIGEFARQGEAGARTDAIAQAAGVNKALIHYYFATKDGLYGAALDEVFRGLAERFLGVIRGPGTAGERLLRHYLAHFDHLAGSSSFAMLLGHEFMRARAGQSTRIAQLVDIFFGPVNEALRAALAEGMERGELRRADPGHLILTLTGANVFYFISAPFFRQITGRDPRDPELLGRQRAALLDTAGTLLFSDPDQGRALAVRILAESRGDRP